MKKLLKIFIENGAIKIDAKNMYFNEIDSDLYKERIFII